MFGPFLLNASISFITDRDLTINSVVEYVKNRTGPFSFNELSGVGFIATSQSTDPSWSDIEFHHSPIGMRYTAADDWTAMFGLKPKILHKYFEPYLLQDANFVLADLGRPLSRGDIKLQSKDPFVHPLIDPKYYSKREDMDAMIEALQFILNMYENTTTWQKVGATLVPTHLPGCEKYTLRSREYFECYLRTLTFTIYHPCGTARMGMAEDNLAVVDGSNLK
jgi:choline dehydrogenase-like flavoprotein